MSAWWPGASAETVCPLSLVRIHAPFRLQTTPGRIASEILSGRCTSPSSFHTFTRIPSRRPRARASSGCISSGGVTSPAGSPPNVEVMRSSDAGEMSSSGNGVS